MLGKVIAGLVGMTVGAEIVKDTVEASRDVYIVPTPTPQYERGGQPLRGVYSTPAPRVTTMLDAFKRQLEPLGFRYDPDESDLKSGDHTRYYFYNYRLGYQLRIKIWKDGYAEFRIQTIKGETLITETTGTCKSSYISVKPMTTISSRYRHCYDDCRQIFNAIARAW